MIVGTAGHIDHGKSTLVHALTGTDPSRLAEEKRRGITIELGYAFMTSDAGARIGFIDVPGHEKLVHTMLAGATGIDLALLLVAADDGIMPQTREHLAILALLGIAQGALVITKCDRASPARIADVAAELRALVEGTPLAGAPIFEVSAAQGTGVEPLRQWLFDRCDKPFDLSSRNADADAQARAGPGFRLAVDRVFTLTGIGTVATGTVFAGLLRVGDTVQVAPAGRTARVRSIHVQNHPSDHAVTGQRCALNLAGMVREDVPRGGWIVSPSIALSTERIDVNLRLWRDEATALRSGATVHVHAGACDGMAQVVLLEGDSLAPGHSLAAQLIMQEPISIWRGDRVVLRDASASRTIGGGYVLDPFAPARYRRTPERLRWLLALAAPTTALRLTAALAQAEHGLDLDRWLRVEGLLPATGDALTHELNLQGLDAIRLPAPGPGDAGAQSGEGRWLIGGPHWQAVQRQLIDATTIFHRQEPDSLGVDTARLKRLAMPRAGHGLFGAALRALLSDGRLERHGAFVHLPGHLVTLAPSEELLAQKILPKLEAGGFDPPWMRDLAKDLGTTEATMRTTLARMAMRGQIHQVVRDLYLTSANVDRLAAIVRRIAAAAADAVAGAKGTDAGAGAGAGETPRTGAHLPVAASSTGGVDAARFRDATGLGRKRAIQILEFFDRVGLLRRVRDTHLLRPGTALFVDEAIGEVGARVSDITPAGDDSSRTPR